MICLLRGTFPFFDKRTRNLLAPGSPDFGKRELKQAAQRCAHKGAGQHISFGIHVAEAFLLHAIVWQFRRTGQAIYCHLEALLIQFPRRCRRC